MSTHEPDYKEKGVVTAEATSGERTDGGIYGGAEKYMKEDNPEKNPAYDPATAQQTGAGVPPTQNELGDRARDAGLKGAPATASDVKGSVVVDDITRRVVVPAPAPTADHLLKNYPGLYPEVEKKEEERKKRLEEEARVKELAKEDKKHHHHRRDSAGSTSSVEKGKTAHRRESGTSVEKEVKVDHHDDGKTAETKVTEKERRHSHDKHHHEEKDHHGMGHKIAHALHLDIGARKKEKERKKEEHEEIEDRKERAAELAEERAIAAETAVNESIQTERDEEPAPPKTGQAYEGGAATDAKQTGTIPMEIMNPEGLQRKEEEERALKEGGNYLDLDFRTPTVESIPKDRIAHMVEDDHRRKAAGLPVEKEISSENIRVNFHTADSFDKLDDAARQSDKEKAPEWLEGGFRARQGSLSHQSGQESDRL